MSTQLLTPGPTYLQVGTGAAGVLEHLGWTERGIRGTFDGGFEDVMTDVSGTRVPFDILYQGEQAFITADLNLYDELILNKVNPRRLGDTEGVVATTAVGSLLRLEGFMFRLLIFCPYSAKAAFANMRPAYNFLKAHLDAAREIELSSRVKIVRCIFRAIPDWSQTSGGGILYNFSTTGIVAVT